MLRFFIFLTLFFGFSAHGLSLQEMTEEEFMALSKNSQPVTVTGDAVPWEIFGKTTENEECGKDEEGFDYCVTKPGYDDGVKSLDDKDVTLMGYMFPLDASEKQSMFLLGPYPLTCPYHYHLGPSQIVEIIAKKPVEFSYDPVTIKGQLKLDFNEETGVFYYLENAVAD